MPPSPLTIFAPAKVNLYLHVTGKRADGYHALDSLVAFADIGDRVFIAAAEGFSFLVEGAFATAFAARDLDASPEGTNLVVRAVWGLSRILGETPQFAVRLEKNLPLGGGIGGGSADAAAVVWGLLKYWDVKPEDVTGLDAFLLQLGADVPVCFYARALRMRGIGDVFDAAPRLPEMACVLVHPMRPSVTKNVFMHYTGGTRDITPLPPRFEGVTHVVDFLERQGNDLYAAACAGVPEIENVLGALEAQDGCGLARMSGSGSTCFGLFADAGAARAAAEEIARDNPDWWVRAGVICDVERY
ncbi:MAG: 4-(cytidine 5'-diphospho)-2-C-methyl-D-erythritol kinase [Alphaproteobacteria bacterium]